MSRFIKISDFEKGKYAIAVNQFSEDDLQQFIDDNEDAILKDLLGGDLFDLFSADFDLGLTEDRFIKIYNSLRLKLTCSEVESKGIQVILKGIIYFLYLKDYEITAGVTGFVEKESENSENSNGIAKQIFGRYNESIESYIVVQNYIVSNPDNYDYALYNGSKKQFVSWL